MLNALTLMLATSGDAQAADGAYMWGVGPSVSTVFYPTRFPGSFPNAITGEGSDWDFDFRPGDIEFAARGLFYLDMDSRLSARVGLGGGPGWYTRWFDVDFDRMLSSTSGFHTFLGVGGGLGKDRYTDSDNDQLEVSFFLVRAQFGGIYRNKTQAYELGLFTAYHVPLEHMLDPADTQEQIKGLGGRYGQVGLEASVYFGDFKPPSSKKKKGKGGKKVK